MSNQVNDGFGRALIVDDEKQVVRALAQLLRTLGVREICTATTAADALELLSLSPNLVVCDLRLGGDSGASVLERARHLVPVPVLVAMSGAASRDEVFELGTRGVAAFLDKPFDLARLGECLRRAALEDPVARVARSEVGVAGAKEAQQRFREAMFREALKRTSGNRHAAARLLKVDRRLVQLMATELDIRGTS